MPLQGNVFAALIAELERRLQTGSSAQYLAFPEFVFRLGLDDLLFDAQQIQDTLGLDSGKAMQEAILNQEAFSALVNPIPSVSSSFVPDGRMLWSVYDRVTSTAELALNDPNVAKDFQDYQTKFDLEARARPDGVVFYPTHPLERNDVRDPDSWTRILLNKAQIDQLSLEVSLSIQSWLAGRGLLDGAADSNVLMNALSMEALTLTLLRPWLDTDLFKQPLVDMG